MRYRLMVAGLLLMGFTCGAQPYLAREITVNGTDVQRLGDLLDSISQRQAFYFSYNSDVVATDKQINMPPYRGTLVGFLEQVFGADYVFKESPGYVIIRYAPRLIDLTVHIEERRGRPLLVEGKVKDAGNGMGINQASVYERNVLVSTLSDPGGNFKLAFRRPNETIWLTISKENYRDTTIALLLPVEVGSKAAARRYWFFPENDGAGLEGTAFGRFFTSSKQRIQRINLDGFFAYNAYQISLTPRISSQGLFNSQVVNRVSLNIIGGHTAGVNGIEVGGVFNVNQRDVGYFQTAGLFNLVGGQVKGVQVAGISNIVAGDVLGIQVGGVSNRAGDVKGMQLSGVFNVADNVRGVQLAGLVNIADSSDYPIGLVNLVKNGGRRVGVGVAEPGMAWLTFRSGGKVMYGLVGVGYGVDGGAQQYGLETGLGAHLLTAGMFGFDAEIANLASTGFEKNSRSRQSLRLLPKLRIDHHWAVMGGPVLTYGYRGTDSGRKKTLHTGLYGGLTYGW
ncbi:hypothetical protein [Parapedobacter sp. 10938]|uniref:hypothetical protein n=1 Tax=Parapedobacter flavus TaxID=3110225 RepID=UPI002DBD0111|nr:hypothetical protein [Parapedobacter sp. 10938]MEC3881110.1 hypothetical protein [Parapedobacter sp. 10938]